MSTLKHLCDLIEDELFLKGEGWLKRNLSEASHEFVASHGKYTVEKHDSGIPHSGHYVAWYQSHKKGSKRERVSDPVQVTSARTTSEAKHRAASMLASDIKQHHAALMSGDRKSRTVERRTGAHDASPIHRSTGANMDFNDFFKSVPGGKKIKKRSPAAQQMKASGAGNKFKNNHANGAGKEAARVTTVRGGKQGGVQRTLEKPHATPDMVNKSFPVMDDKAFRLTQYTMEDAASEE